MILVNFNLTMFHKYSISDIEGMIPWERDAYVGLITDYVEAENRRIEAEAAKHK